MLTRRKLIATALHSALAPGKHPLEIRLGHSGRLLKSGELRVR
jgi:hypothetical protein